MDNGLLFPYHFCGGRGGTRKGKQSAPSGHGAFSVLGNAGAGKSTLDAKLKTEGSCGEIQGDSAHPKPPRKASLPVTRAAVPKPTLVGGDKCPKVIERTLVKELGNLTP